MDLKNKTECIICSTEQHSFTKLQKHVLTEHNLLSEHYYVQLLHNGIHPVCSCGCGELTTFFKNTRSFGEFKRGHISRIKNNWGHNKEALDKSHQTMREKRLDGECPAWNKGLNKETDERVAAYGKSQSQNFTDERREILSNRMHTQRLNGVIPTLRGSKHSQWKGGTSSLNGLAHSNHRLYQMWKFPKLKAANFVCTRCTSTKNLCVHHDKELMSDVIHNIVKKFDYDDSTSTHEQRNIIVDAIIDYHIENNVSGVVLCYQCHKKEHASLNFNPNTTT